MGTSQSGLVNSARQNDSRTNNGAVTHSTSLNNVVDMFFLAGASRTMSEQDIINVFTRAYTEDKVLALKCLFWARDIRGGAGERRFFTTILKHMLTAYPHDFQALYEFVPSYGYWKDLFAHFDPHSINLEWLAAQIDSKDNGLVCKWMPRKGIWFNEVRKYMKLSPKELRQHLVKHSSTVEQLMCAGLWNEIKYSGVPSQAFRIYKNAFEKRDTDRFQMFLQKAVKGEEKVNAGAIFPYQLYQSFMKGENRDSIIAQWNNLIDYVGEGSFLPVCDVSGSMSGLPMEISISLGVYLSERNKGIFKDAFITFSGKPTMEYLQGNVVQRFEQLRRAHWQMNTNLQATFELILASAVRGNLKQEDMPKNIIVISDMEFDSQYVQKPNFELVQDQFKAAGYEMPRLIFWNVNGRIGNVPVSASQKDVALVSGASPAIVQSVLSGKDFTPRGIMLEALMADRYAPIGEGL